MNSLKKVPNVRIAAVCDIYDTHLKQARELADPKAFATKHYKEVLDRRRSPGQSGTPQRTGRRVEGLRVCILNCRPSL
jgi:hypothetical protein